MHLRALRLVLVGVGLGACATQDGPPPDSRASDASAPSSTAAVPAPRAKVDSCLTGPQFVLGDVELHAPDSLARAPLGEPTGVARRTDEDDGGVVPLLTYRYATLEMDIVRNKVDRVHTRDTTVGGPLGLRVGLPGDSAVARLAAAGVVRAAAADTIQAPHCDGASHLVLAVGSDGHVASIAIVVERP